MPPVPGFYSLPRTLDDMIDQTVGRALDLFDFDMNVVRRWTEEPGASRSHTGTTREAGTKKRGIGAIDSIPAGRGAASNATRASRLD